MRTKRMVAGKDWEFDGSTITVRVSMIFGPPQRSQGDRRPNGGDAWASAKPRPDETLIRALARAHRWKRMLEDGKYWSAVEIAEAEGVTRSFVSRLDAAVLGHRPEAILDGRQPKSLELAALSSDQPALRAHLDHRHHQPRLRRMAERLRRCEDDDGAPRSPHPSLRDHRDRQRVLALQEPRLIPHSLPRWANRPPPARAAPSLLGALHVTRGSLLFATWTSPQPRSKRGPFCMPIRGPVPVPIDR